MGVASPQVCFQLRSALADSLTAVASLLRSWCSQPRLVRFVGRPQDYSPQARLLNLLGYKLPFDRHDWVVDRCGREVRRTRRGD